MCTSMHACVYVWWGGALYMSICVCNHNLILSLKLCILNFFFFMITIYWHGKRISSYLFQILQIVSLIDRNALFYLSLVCPGHGTLDLTSIIDGQYCRTSYWCLLTKVVSFCGNLLSVTSLKLKFSWVIQFDVGLFKNKLYGHRLEAYLNLGEGVLT